MTIVGGHSQLLRCCCDLTCKTKKAVISLKHQRDLLNEASVPRAHKALTDKYFLCDSFRNDHWPGPALAPRHLKYSTQSLHFTTQKKAGLLFAILVSLELIAFLELEDF